MGSRVWLFRWHISKLSRTLIMDVFLNVDAIVMVRLCFEPAVIGPIPHVGVLTGRDVLAARSHHNGKDSLHQRSKCRNTGTCYTETGFNGGEVTNDGECPCYVAPVIARSD